MLPEGMPEDHINYLNYYNNKDKDISAAPEKNHFTNKQIIAALAGIAILAVIGGYTANKIFNKNQPNTEISTAPIETPQVTVEKPVNDTTEIMPTVESLEIDASLISKPEELVKLFMEDRTTAWINSGATPENDTAPIDIIIEEYAKSIAPKYDQIFIDALMPKDWESNESQKGWVNRQKEVHLSTLIAYFKTHHDKDMMAHFPGDREPYSRGIKVNKVDVIYKTSDSIDVTAVTNDYDTSEYNRLKGNGVTGQDNYPNLSFKVIDGKIKLVDKVFK